VCRAPASGLRASAFRGTPVLVVDSCERWAELVSSSFRGLGYETVAQPSLGAALRSLEAIIPSLVCSEAKMGTDDWCDLCAQAKRLHESVKFVLITNFITPAGAFHALRQGCDLVLAKPAFAHDVLFGLGQGFDEQAMAMPLEAAKKIYIAQTLTECSTLAEASRELAVERRSLRRMMAKVGKRVSGTYETASVHARPRQAAR
jgi:ActR/RegA family two-component response regulator